VEENPTVCDVEQFHGQFHTSNPILPEIEVLYYLRTADRGVLIAPSATKCVASCRGTVEFQGEHLSRGKNNSTLRRAYEDLFGRLLPVSAF
jgi:hypothetical protein